MRLYPAFLPTPRLFREATMLIDTQNIIENNKRSANDTGSPEVQIALLTARIELLTKHFKIHKKTIIAAVVCCRWLIAVAVCLITLIKGQRTL